MPPKRSKRPRKSTSPIPTRDGSGIPDPAAYSLQQLLSLPVTSLRSMLKDLALPTEGTKKQLATRLHSNFQQGSSSESTQLRTLVARLVQEGVQSALRQITPAASSSNISLSYGFPTRTTSPQQDVHNVPLPPSPTLATALPSSSDPSPSQAHPVDPPSVPTHIWTKILKGEYVDFNSLLHENMFPPPTSGPTFILQVQQDPESQADSLVVSRPKHRRKQISNLPSWLQAWNIFIAVVISEQPHRAADFLAYQRFICEVSARAPSHAWLRYDSKF